MLSVPLIAFTYFFFVSGIVACMSLSAFLCNWYLCFPVSEGWVVHCPLLPVAWWSSIWKGQACTHTVKIMFLSSVLLWQLSNSLSGHQGLSWKVEKSAVGDIINTVILSPLTGRVAKWENKNTFLSHTQILQCLWNEHIILFQKRDATHNDGPS